MEKYRGINQFRRKLLHALTRNLRTDKVCVPKPDSVSRILICRPNSRLGNMLLLTPLVREMQSAFPNAGIDLFVKGPNASKVFREFRQIGDLIELPERPFSNIFKYAAGWLKVRARKYDLVFNADPASSSGRLSTKWARSNCKLIGEPGPSFSLKYPDSAHMAKNPVLRFREFLGSGNIAPRNSRLPEPSLCLTKEELGQGRQKLREMLRNDQPVVCLFTYASGRKDFGAEWWQEFYSRLKSELPAVNFIEMLPAHGASALKYNIPSVFSRNIREMGAVAANCSALIAADGGVMHLASAAGVPVIGLFKVTRKDKYAPYNRQSLGMDMNVHSQEDVVRQLKRILGPKVMLHPGLALTREFAN